MPSRAACRATCDCARACHPRGVACASSLPFLGSLGAGAWNPWRGPPLGRPPTHLATAPANNRVVWHRCLTRRVPPVRCVHASPCSQPPLRQTPPARRRRAASTHAAGFAACRGQRHARAAPGGCSRFVAAEKHPGGRPGDSVGPRASTHRCSRARCLRSPLVHRPAWSGTADAVRGSQRGALRCGLLRPGLSPAARQLNAPLTPAFHCGAVL